MLLIRDYHRKMSQGGYIIAEFNDGVQVIPSLWYNADRQSSFWPGHLKTQLRINKAIISREIPKEESDWEILSVKRIFGTAGKIGTFEIYLRSVVSQYTYIRIGKVNRLIYIY